MYSRLFLEIITTVPSTSYFLPFKKNLPSNYNKMHTFWQMGTPPWSRYRTYISPQQLPSCPLLSLSTPQPQATSDELHSVTLDQLTFSRISYKKNHTECTLLCQSSFTLHNHIFFAMCLYHAPIKDGMYFSISWIYASPLTCFDQ